MRTLLAIVVLVMLALGVAACGGSGSSGSVVMDEPVPAGAEGAHVVELTFSPTDITPSTVSVKSGEKVLFVIKNTDPKEDHNLVASDVSIKEILVKPNQTVRRLWTVPSKTGDFPIGCTIHPEIRMKMTLQ